MFKYTPKNQLEIFDFKTDFESKLNPNNRWVMMAKLLDWDAIAAIYSRSFSARRGVKSIDARIVVGALIIKHTEGKDDRGTLEMIQENPYMQFFLGLDHFTDKILFDPSLFVYIRKRLGNKEFDEMNQLIIQKALNMNPKEEHEKEDLGDEDGAKDQEHSNKLPKNKGKLQLDATVADAHIKYPTDLNLLNESREISEKLINRLYLSFPIKNKPRTYRRIARKKYLLIAKKKKKTKQEIRRGIREQLGFLKRNLQHIDKILTDHPLALGLLDKKEYRYYLIIQELYRQQRAMYDACVKSIPNRIVSIHQPHIRPIVRGKEGRDVEFGAKINVSLQAGYGRINQLNFEAYNESVYLKNQVESFRNLNGCYPELVQTDDIYMTRENRKYLKENGIRHTGKALGRKPKQESSRYQKEKLKKERGERNHIEGKFGQGKGKYKLNKIMAKLPNTAESWVATIFFVMNILKLSKEYLCLFFNLLFFSRKATPKTQQNHNCTLVFNIL